MKEDQKIFIYQTEDGKTQIDVRLEDDTVWLNVAQMASLFMKEESNVRRHVLNAFKDGELERDDNNVHFLHVNGVKKPGSQRDRWLARYQKSTSNLHGVDLFFSMSSFSGRLRLLVEGVSPINGDTPRIRR